MLLPKPTPTQSKTVPTPTQSPTSKPPQIFSPVVMTLGDSDEVKMGETVFYKGKDAYGRPK